MQWPMNVLYLLIISVTIKKRQRSIFTLRGQRPRFYVTVGLRGENNHKNSGHFVPLQRPRAAQALRSDQNYVKVGRQNQDKTKKVEKSRDSKRRKAGNMIESTKGEKEEGLWKRLQL